MPSPQGYLILCGAAFLGGAVNSVAGGGTLLTFPALLAAGFAAKIANATSTVALWPGQLSSLWGYRRELEQTRGAIVRLAIPSLVGGGVGACLLLETPSHLFDRLVPYLILAATCLFMSQEAVSRWLRARVNAAEASAPIDENETIRRSWVLVMLFQFFVAIYGGYFGAGIGILMLASLGYMGFTNIHRMNGLKNINGLCINAVAAVIFISARLVDWHIAGVMAAASIVGGYGGAGTARRMGQRNVRRLVIVIGFGLAFSLLIRR